jgi:acyl-coenzyme A thioesterase 13
MTDLNSSTIIQPSPELEHIKSVWQAMLGKSAIYEFLLSPQDITLTSASKGKFTAQLKLSSRHVNSRGTIHGGVSA